MKLFMLTILVFASFARSSFGAFCTYKRSSDRVTCGQVTCQTAIPASSADKTPAGYYYIGKYYTHPKHDVGWFNLYPKRRAGGFWDYYTKVPDLDCRGYFGLHAGTISEGCITVTDTSCFNRLRKQITDRFQVKHFCVHRCRWFSCRPCWRVTVNRPRTTDLRVF